MAMVYFKSDSGTRVFMDTETEVNVSLPSTVTSTSMSSGKTGAHTVIEGNATITVTGKVTYSKTLLQQDHLNPIQFQQEIQKCRRQRRRFTVYVKDYSQPLLDNYRNCVIKDATYTVSKYADTIDVVLTFEQVFVTSAAKKSFLAPKPAQEAKPDVGSTEDKGKGTKTEEQPEEKATILEKMFGTDEDTRGSQSIQDAVSDYNPL